MEFARWYVLIGLLLILLVIASGTLRRLPISTAMLYLALGWVVGTLGWIALDPLEHGRILEVATEIAVIVSLFAAGLKLRRPLRSRLWRLPVLLASLSMLLTVTLIAGLGWAWLGLPLGAAIILGAVLAPTDPVLAAEVQVEHPNDVDRLRFTLTGEAGMNDGTAFPFVMLGLGLLGLHELGDNGWRWVAIDLVWACAAGLGVGTLLGAGVGRLIVYLRRRRREAVGYDDFLAIGLIAASYGIALTIHAYGFLAVFAAGLALRGVERELSGDPEKTEVTNVDAAESEMASHPHRAPGFMAAAVLQFDEHLERLCELSLMLVAGALLSTVQPSLSSAAFALVLLLVLRPLAVAPVCLAGGMNRHQAALVSWFGLRGIGSLYYLFFAVGKGLDGTVARLIADVVLVAIAASVVLHGISVTPLMRRYEQART
ncbi:MAG TPA: cation:proton antiporter [Burkholderiales bacterium]|nr:cation:proton antiporter [Burkholderiales bacterium]